MAQNAAQLTTDELHRQLLQRVRLIQCTIGDVLTTIPRGNRIKIDECLVTIERAAKDAQALNYRLASGGQW